MEPILQQLDAQWPQLASSPGARRALIRWANDHEAFVGMRDLQDVVRCRRDPTTAHQVLHVLARLAATDELAARTLLQLLLPGLVRLVGTVGFDDPDAPDEVVSIAWERIRTYPTTRKGSVAGNVVLDVRKRYMKLRRGRGATPLHLLGDRASATARPEDQALASMQLEEIIRARQTGIVSPLSFEAIVRTRLDGESLAEVAARFGLSAEVVCQRRWRAEQRLRTLPLAG